MPRFAGPVSAAPVKKGAAIQAAAPRPRRAGPERGPAWHAIQFKAARSAAPAAGAKAHSASGLPAPLQAGIEQLSGLAMDDIRVHRNSAEPAKLGALAYTRGSDIHLGPGQERHLPHEAWHVVQQKQGRVRATTQLKSGAAVNDDSALEREADAVAQRLTVGGPPGSAPRASPAIASPGPVFQLKTLPSTDGYSTRRDRQPIVYFGSGGGKEVDSYWRCNQTQTDDSRAVVIGMIARKAGELGNAVESSTPWTHRAADSDINRDDYRYYNPIRVEYPGQYKVGMTPKNLSLEYHFGEAFNGYVVHVTDLEHGLNHEMKDAESDAIEDATTEYSKIHEPQAHGNRALEAEADADSITKIAAEGARWAVIRRNAGSVRDSSKIYTNESQNGEPTVEVRYITFKTLWKSWKAAFDKRYNIPDSDVIDELKKDEIEITSRVANTAAIQTSASSNMRVTHDFCLDDPEPDAQAELDAATVRMLHYKSNAAIDFTQSLADHILAVRTVFDAAGTAALSVEYIGKQLFACTAALTAHQKPILAGYTQVAQGDTNLRYPAYREPKLADLIETRVLAGDGGETAYDAEWKDAYEAGTRALIYRLATDRAGDDNEALGKIDPDSDEVEGVDVKKLVAELDDNLVVAAVNQNGEDAAIGELTTLFEAAL